MTAQPHQAVPQQDAVSWRTRLRKLRKNYTVRVLAQGALTIWAVTTFTFFLIRLMPGNRSPDIVRSWEPNNTHHPELPANVWPDHLVGRGPVPPILPEPRILLSNLAHRPR